MNAKGTQQFIEEALKNCESEPIHIPGKIQPHGVLLAFDPETLEVTIASQNASEHLDLTASEIVGSELGRVVGSPARDRIVRLMASDSLQRPCRFLASIHRADTTWKAEASLHRRGSRFLLELEQADPDGVTATLQLADWIHRFPRNDREADSIIPLCQAITAEVRKLSGYDRTMILRFHPDLHGEVIAESIRTDLTTYLGLHYPASDIPNQARSLYLQNRVRVLIDVRAKSAELISRPDDFSSEPVDMTFCQLRSFSPVHLEYLDNMGIRSSLVTSIIHDDRLWGLLVCHHDSPRRPSHALRAACNLLSELISVEIASQEKRDHLKAQRIVGNLQKRLVETSLEDKDWKATLLTSPSAHLSPILSGGLAVVEGTNLKSRGTIPDEPRLLQIRDWIVENHPGSVFWTDSLGGLAHQFAGIDSACGILAVEIARNPPTHLIWFRSEYIREVTWAGEPNKDIVVGGGEPRLSPRKSFEAWKAEVLGHSASWERLDRASASELRRSVIEAVLRTSLLRGAIAELELVRVRKAVEASSEAILIADEKGRPTFVNQAFAKLCRLTLEDLPSRSLSAPITNLALRDQILEATLVKGGSWQGEVEVRRPDEGSTPVALGIDPVLGENGVVLGFIALHFDLTERNRARRVLEDHAERLEMARNEIETQSLQLEEARARAEAANRAKSDFLANMCHEIRTPMNGVIGICELLLDTNLNEVQQKYARIIRASGDALMTLINDILDLSKVEAGKMTIVPTRFDLRTMFKELGDLFEPRAQKHGVIVSILVEDDVPRELLGDAIRIRQILSNLAGNAIKFTEHGEVDIIARLIEASAADVKIRIEVKDSGIGIPSSMNQSIFESFTQGESGNIRASSGTGLGLTICRKLADLMGGKVDYTSEEGKGSTFWLELTLQRPDEPVVKPSETSRSNEKPIVASGQKLRILVAEDNAVNQMVARGLIAKIGHDVTIVENGAEALEILSRESFDLILMDIQMPIMDGYTATAEIRIREAALGRRTPIVALTAYAMKDERQNCLNADMDDYLSKPISIVKLRELLERFNLETPKA